MEYKLLKKKKGVAGLDLAQDFVVRLFVIGLLIMAIAIAGAQMLDLSVISGSKEATSAINDTVVGIAGLTDWIPLWVIMVAIVVLILLVVIIVRAVKGAEGRN